MVDGRTRVLFDSGTEHRYKPSSMGKLTMINARKKLQRAFTLTSILAKEDPDTSQSSTHEPIPEASAVGARSSTPKEIQSPPKSVKSENNLRSSPKKAERKLRALMDFRQMQSAAQESVDEDMEQGIVASRFGPDMKLVIVHTINDAEDGCEFEHFFTTAPPDLVQAGIFSQIASPLFFYSSDFRKV